MEKHALVVSGSSHDTSCSTENKTNTLAFGRWRTRSWIHFIEHTKDVSVGLKALKPDAVSNRPFCSVCNLARTVRRKTTANRRADTIDGLWLTTGRPGELNATRTNNEDWNCLKFSIIQWRDRRVFVTIKRAGHCHWAAAGGATRSSSIRKQKRFVGLLFSISWVFSKVLLEASKLIGGGDGKVARHTRCFPAWSQCPYRMSKCFVSPNTLTDHINIKILTGVGYAPSSTISGSTTLGHIPYQRRSVKFKNTSIWMGMRYNMNLVIVKFSWNKCVRYVNVCQHLKASMETMRILAFRCGGWPAPFDLSEKWRDHFCLPWRLELLRLPTDESPLCKKRARTLRLCQRLP